MAKILVSDEISREGLDILSQAVEVTYEPQISPSELIEVIPQYDALLVRSRTKVTAEVIAAGKRLQAVGRAGVGVDNIDLVAATEAGVLVINSPEGNTASAAEHTLALMFSLSRQIPAADQSMKAGEWKRSHFMGTELFNKTLGVIGLGKIGSRVAQAAQAIGMKVIVHDPLISSERAAKLNMTCVTLDELWQRADYITIHTPKTRETSNLINETVLSKVKTGVRIINTARGGIIDEAALAQAITDGRVAGAALDVYGAEPPAGSPLLALGGKVVLTPHLGASTVEAQYNVAIDLAEQLTELLTGGMARSPVNLPSMRPDLLKALGKYFWLAEAAGAMAGGLADGTVKEVELISCGHLAQQDTTPLTVAALRGVFSGKVEAVTYVNAHLVARHHGIVVRESKLEESQQYPSEFQVVVTTDVETATISATVLPHDEPIVTSINDYPINLTPARHMLFTSHRDQPGMVAKVAGSLGRYDINISTMSVGRRGVRQDAVMVMTLDDPLPAALVAELADEKGIHRARYVCLDQMSWGGVHA